MPFTNILLANWYAAVCGSILMFKTVKTHQTVKNLSPTLYIDNIYKMYKALKVKNRKYLVRIY
jgi:hypothetical protein